MNIDSKAISNLYKKNDQLNHNNQIISNINDTDQNNLQELSNDKLAFLINSNRISDSKRYNQTIYNSNSKELIKAISLKRAYILQK